MKKTKFGLGLVIGALAGVVTGLLVAPKPGKKTREEWAKKLKQMKKSFDSGDLKEQVQDIFGDVSDESMRLYKNAKKTLIKKLDSITDEIDMDKYKKIVEDVVEQVTEGAKTSADKLNTLKDRLMKEWDDESSTK